jgi:hypothetical protein
MKIEWIIESREVPVIGYIETGQIKNVPRYIGVELIKQNHAKGIKKVNKSIEKEVK